MNKISSVVHRLAMRCGLQTYLGNGAEGVPKMRTLLIASATLAVLTSPAAALAAQSAAANTNARTASATHSQKMTRAEASCVNSARSKYKAGEMRNRAEARCMTSKHASQHQASRTTSRKS
jgi:hypothetical protein